MTLHAAGLSAGIGFGVIGESLGRRGCLRRPASINSLAADRWGPQVRRKMNQTPGPSRANCHASMSAFPNTIF